MMVVRSVVDSVCFKRFTWVCRVVGVVCFVTMACGSDKRDARPALPASAFVGPGESTDTTPNATSSLFVDTGQSNDTDRPGVSDDSSVFPSDRDRHTERALETGVYDRARVLSFRSHSVLLYFRDGTRGVFKPFLNDNSTARFEFAFYRMARWLGVGTVPVASFRIEYPDKMKALLQKDTRVTEAFFDQMSRSDNGRIYGVVIEWLDDIEPPPFCGHRAVPELLALFAAGDGDLARDVSNMLVIDYLVGNWDRFSGGNVFWFKGDNRLAMIDHNGAFYRLNDKQNAKLEGYLDLCPFFSSRLLQRIRDMDEDTIRRIVRTDASEATVLGSNEIFNLQERSKMLEAYMGRRRTSADKSAVFF